MSEAARTVVIARQKFALRSSQVERRMRGVLPEPVKDHFVVIDRRRYPPKQVVGLLTGLDRAAFTTHHARRILTGLGFPAGREPPRPQDAGRAPTRVGSAPRVRGGGSRGVGAPSPRAPAEALEPFVGQWVATRGAAVLVAATDPGTVVEWLARHGEQADSMFRVPRDEVEASGAAPL